MFVARKSNHIEADIIRNWSSWNFGEDGFTGTREELNSYLADCSDENPIAISGFEIFPADLKSYEFGELYPNYWVAIDRVNARNGLSCIELQAETLGDAIKEATERTDYFGEGSSFDAKDAKFIQSVNDIHIFEI
jgi:hypothetical protein